MCHTHSSLRWAYFFYACNGRVIIQPWYKRVWNSAQKNLESMAINNVLASAGVSFRLQLLFYARVAQQFAHMGTRFLSRSLYSTASGQPPDTDIHNFIDWSCKKERFKKVN